MLDRTFFSDHLPNLVDAETETHAGTKPHVDLILHHGVAFRAVGAIEARDTFITFTTTERNVTRRVVVPYGTILAVSLDPQTPTKEKPGFVR